MKVKELIQLLKENFDDEDEVVMSSDGEGNVFSLLNDAEAVVYVPTTETFGEAYLRELTTEMLKEGFTKDDLYDGDDGINAVVLYPVG